MVMSNAPQGGEGRIANASQLQRAQAQRQELQAQIEALSDRRGRLIQERLNAQAAGSPGVAREIEQQVTELSGRLRGLDKQVIDLNESIMDALKRGVGQEAIEVAPVPSPPGVPAPPLPGEAWSLLPPPGPQLSWFQINAERLLVFEALAFVLLGAVMWRALRRGRSPAAQLPDATEMRQALDAIAVEVERISENQRYVTKLLAERMGEAPAPAIASSDKDRVNAR